MRMLRLFLTVCLLLFSGTVVAESLDSLMLKLESDIAGNRQEEVKRDIEKILELKKQLPVNHIPELNYLLNREVDRIPPTRIHRLKESLYYLTPVYRGVYMVTFLLVFYTFIYYFQQIRGGQRRRDVLTFLSVVVPVLSLFTGSVSLFLLSASASVLPGAVLRKAGIAFVTAL